MVANAPGPGRRRRTSPPPSNGWMVVLCVVLGGGCFVFAITEAFGTSAFDRTLVYTGIALWLVAVGGAATGRWGEFSVGGAIAVVIILFALNPSPLPERAAEIKIRSNSFFQEVERTELLSDGKFFYSRHVPVDREAFFRIDEDAMGGLDFRFRIHPAAQNGRKLGPISIILCAVSLEAAMKRYDRDGPLPLVYNHDNPALAHDDFPLTLPQSKEEGCSSTVEVAEPTWWMALFKWVQGLVPTAVAQELDRNSAIDELLTALKSSNAIEQTQAIELLSADPDPMALSKVISQAPDPTSPEFVPYGALTLDLIQSMANRGVAPSAISAAIPLEFKDYFAHLYAADDGSLAAQTANTLTMLQDPQATAQLIGLVREKGVPANARTETARALAAGYFAADSLEKDNLFGELQPSELYSAMDFTGIETDEILVAQLEQLTSGSIQDSGWVFVNSSNTELLNANAGQRFSVDQPLLYEQSPATFSADEGWQLQPITGAVEAGATFEVKDVQQVAPGFTWVNVAPVVQGTQQ